MLHMEDEETHFMGLEDEDYRGWNRGSYSFIILYYFSLKEKHAYALLLFSKFAFYNLVITLIIRGEQSINNRIDQTD